MLRHPLLPVLHGIHSRDVLRYESVMAQHCTKLQTAYNLGSFTNVNTPHNCYMNPSLLPTVPAPPSSQPFWAPTFSQPFWPLPPPNCSSPSLLPTVQAPPSSQPFRSLPSPNC